MDKQIEDALIDFYGGRASRQEFLQVVFAFVTTHPEKLKMVVGELRGSDDEDMVVVANCVAKLTSARH